MPLYWEPAQQCWGTVLLLPAVAWLEEDPESWKKAPFLLLYCNFPVDKASIFPAGEEAAFKGPVSIFTEQPIVGGFSLGGSKVSNPYTNLEYVLFCWASGKYSSQNT